MVMKQLPELVGIAQIAEKLRVPRPTIDSWKRRGLLPEPNGYVGIHPVWIWSELKKHVVEETRVRVK